MHLPIPAAREGEVRRSAALAGTLLAVVIELHIGPPASRQADSQAGNTPISNTAAPMCYLASVDKPQPDDVRMSRCDECVRGRVGKRRCQACQGSGFVYRRVFVTAGGLVCWI